MRDFHIFVELIVSFGKLLKKCILREKKIAAGASVGVRISTMSDVQLFSRVKNRFRTTELGIRKKFGESFSRFVVVMFSCTSRTY